jgi:hypothetical protein
MCVYVDMCLCVTKGDQKANRGNAPNTPGTRDSKAHTLDNSRSQFLTIGVCVCVSSREESNNVVALINVAFRVQGATDSTKQTLEHQYNHQHHECSEVSRETGLQHCCV